MRDAEVVEAVRLKLATPAGRHLYGVLGTYKALNGFAHTLQQGRMLDGRSFPEPLSVNRGVLDVLTDVQKVAKPENWEILRPYAEKLLGRTIESTRDDAAITRCRTDLRDLFAKQRDVAVRAASRAVALFEILKVANPYAEELRQVAVLFATDVASGSDIDLVLHGLKQAFGYQAYDTNVVTQTEVDDLAVRLKNYHDVQIFLGYASDLETACAYRDQPLPDLPELRDVARIRRDVTAKLAEPRPFIDSEVKLKTELIGHLPPEPGETGTIGALVQEYTTVYVNFHESVFSLLGEERRKIRDLLRGDDLKALKILERIPTLQPGLASTLEATLAALAASIFACPAASRASLESQLKRGPTHECGLTFLNGDGHLEDAERQARQAQMAIDDVFAQKLAVFLHPVVRERLEQGRAEPVILGILKSETLAQLRSFLVTACLADDSVVETINRFLKLIVVRRVKLTDFRPSLSTVEKNQVVTLADDFRRFLEAQLGEISADAEVLPMLQLE